MPVADRARPENLPIVDFHSHLNGDMDAGRLLELMELSGVRAMVLMARYYANPRDAGYGSDQQAAGFARDHAGRFIPFVAGQRRELGRSAGSAWQDPAAAAQYLAEAERKLRSGEFYGLGEYILRHHAYTLAASGQRGGEVSLPADAPLMHQIAALGAKYGVPVVVHLEAEPEQTDQAVRLFEKHPDTPFIWAHNCGRAGADQIRRLLGRFPRLMCDLGGMMVTPSDPGGYGRYWPRRTPYIHLVQADGGSVYPEMLALFEEFSDRFLLGTDTAHTPALRFYGERIYAMRQMLSQLSPAAAGRIAHENAERLLASRRIPN
ncbi:MAG: amidohydrolase family protein [SAR324 cluster bacterium]